MKSKFTCLSQWRGATATSSHPITTPRTFRGFTFYISLHFRFTLHYTPIQPLDLICLALDKKSHFWMSWLEMSTVNWPLNWHFLHVVSIWILNFVTSSHIWIFGYLDIVSRFWYCLQIWILSQDLYILILPPRADGGKLFVQPCKAPLLVASSWSNIPLHIFKNMIKHHNSFLEIWSNITLHF